MKISQTAKMKRKDAVELYSVLKDLRNGAMSKEGMTDYILMRLKLKKVYDEFEQARIEISEQTRQDGIDKWNEAFTPIMERWLSEETELIETKVLSQSDFVELVSKNDLIGIIEDNLYTLLIKI